MVYVEAFYADGSQILGNGEGQGPIKAKLYRRTDFYYRMKYQGIGQRVHHWLVKDEGGRVLETIENPSYRAPVTSEQKARTKAARIRKHGGDDLYSWALLINGRIAYNGMSRSEATWRRDRYINKGEL